MEYLILKSAEEKLLSFPENTKGTLYGLKSGKQMIISSILCDELKNNEENYFPGGLHYLGTFSCSTNDGLSSTSDSLKTMVCCVDVTGKKCIFYMDDKQLKVTVADESEVFGNFISCRVKYVTDVFVFEKTQKHTDEIFEQLRNRILDNNFALITEQNGTFIAPDNRQLSDALKLKPVKSCDLSKITNLTATININLSKKLNFLHSLSKSSGAKTVIEMQFVLDTLTIASLKSTMDAFFRDISVSLQRSLNLQREQLLTEPISQPEIFHFLPFNCNNFFTICYPQNAKEDDLADYRKKLHKLFALPDDRPLLRRCNVLAFNLNNKFEGLISPHESLPESGVAGGDPALVKGKYAYYHYLQQGMQDSGWGCAYRSLQTICSWFRLQGYTNRTEPSLKEIQKCLVNIKDKPSSFIGSSQWIGSTEVSFVLSTLYGIESRIIAVSSGEELSMKGGELSHHFRNQGTPIMIGGGQLAHTILGVDYNRKTGAIKFLILDPHYTGQDNLDTVLAKGWCGWKGPEFWKKTCFYNMCLPQRPTCI